MNFDFEISRTDYICIYQTLVCLHTKDKANLQLQGFTRYAKLPGL